MAWSVTAAPASLSAGDWPQLLGPERSGVYEGSPLARDWSPIGERILWQLPLGEGFAGPVVADGRLIVFYRMRNQEVVAALDPDTGERLWAYVYPTEYEDSFGFNAGPRATPTVAGGRVFTVGAEGRISALDARTGKPLWSLNSAQRFQARKGFFGVACSPLVVDGKVIVNVGGLGGAGIVALEAVSGEVAWTATDDEASYSSPVAATLGGRRQVLVLTREGLVVLDPKTGAVRYRFPFRSRMKASVNAASPLVIGEQVFLSSSYGAGARLLDFSAEIPKTVWESTEVLSNHYATSVVHGGYLYGFHGRQEARPSLRAVKLATGKVAWSEERFGAGAVLLAGDDLLILREDGELLLAPATPEGFRAVTRGRVVVGKVLSYPALSDGRLYIRSEQGPRGERGLLVAVDLRPRLAAP